MVSRLLFAAVAVAVATTPSLAEKIVVTAPAPSFRDLEFTGGSDRLAVARAGLAQAIPVGSSVTGARAVLTHAGARCKDAAADRLRCTSNHFETVDNVLHDVTWTVAVGHDGDAVTSLAVDRASFGS